MFQTQCPTNGQGLELEQTPCGQGCPGRITQALGSEPQEQGAVKHRTAHCTWGPPSTPFFLPEFEPTVQPGFWKLPRIWTHTNTSMVYPTIEIQDSFSEEHSDLCLVQLLGTGWAPYVCPLPENPKVLSSPILLSH